MVIYPIHNNEDPCYLRPPVSTLLGVLNWSVFPFVTIVYPHTSNSGDASLYKEFLLVAIVDPRSSNSRSPSYYSRKSHFISGRERDGKWDHFSNAYHFQQRRWLFNIGCMIFASLAPIIIAVYHSPFPSVVHDDRDACYLRPPSPLLSTNIR